jgi:hypothetical protein
MGLIRGMARTAVVAGTATAVSNRVSRRQARRWAEQDSYEAGYDAYPPPAPSYATAPAPAYAAPAAPGGGDDVASTLQQLITLREQGMLTDAEFSAAKAKLLGT